EGRRECGGHHDRTPEEDQETQVSERTNPYMPSGREIVKLGKDRIVKNKGRLNRRILIGVPTLGLIRIEWDVHRRGQTIPINWQVGEITANHMPPSVFS